jgi:hypothetical protein
VSILKKQSVKALVIFFAGFLITSCQAIENRYSLKAEKESITHKDTDIKYQEGLLVVGAPRYKVLAAYGPPNGTDVEAGKTEDVYIFLEDGSKYVNPSPRARNVALAVVTAGVSVAVRQARLAHQRTNLIIYHVFYGADDKIYRVDKEGGSAFKNPAKTD